MRSRTSSAAAPCHSGPDAGFSLIELMVVVAILGVLAAIGVPTFLAAQSRARDASVQADLVNAKTALTAFAAGHDGALPSAITTSGSASWAATTVDLKQFGWSLGADTTTIAYTPSAGSSWCLQATSTSGVVFQVTPASAVVRGASCPPTP